MDTLISYETFARMTAALRPHGGGTVLRVDERADGAMLVTVRTTILRRIVVLVVPADIGDDPS